MSQQGITSPSGAPSTGGSSSSWQNPTTASQQQTSQPSDSSRKQRAEDEDLAMGGQSPGHDTVPLGQSTLKDVVGDAKVGEDVEVQGSMPAPSSADRTQPLTGGPAMIEAREDISEGSSGSRLRVNEKISFPSKAAQLRETIQARRQVEAARKAEADKAAVTGQAAGPRPEKRDRAPSLNAQIDSSKKAKSDLPPPEAMDVDMRQEPAKKRATSFDNLHRQNLRCAVQIESNAIMGNPFESSEGFDIKFKLDPGRYGQPSVGFDFRISKDGTPLVDAKGNTKSDNNSFSMKWEPGVKIGGEWMMEYLQIAPAQNPTTANMLKNTYPEHIKNLCEKNPGIAHKLLCAVFKSNVHETQHVDLDWPLALKTSDRDAAHANLKSMFLSPNPSYRVTVWFLLPTATMERFFEGGAQLLIDAVEEHTPPFYQYLDENDKPMLGFDMPSIDAIGNGMYRTRTGAQRGAKVTAQKGPSYYNFPKVASWDSLKTFNVSYGVPVVRDMQYAKGVHATIEEGWHGVFIQRMPVLDFGGKDANPNKDVWSRSVIVGVRLNRDPTTGLKDVAPPVGSNILFDFYNGSQKEGREHQTIKENICFGRVDNLGGKAWLQATGTDFCVIMTRPRGLKLGSDKKPVNKKTLPFAKLDVKVDRTAAVRDLAAFAKFCDEEYEPALLDRLRLAFVSDPSKTSEKVDLTVGPAHKKSEDNKQKYQRIVADLKAMGETNASQDAALQAATRMHSRIAVVQGPPGAGKTRTLRNKLISLVKVGHKAVCVASSNVAVDTDAQAVWTALSLEERKTYRCLRLETHGAEKAQRLAKVGYADYTGEELKEEKHAEYRVAPEAEDNPAIRNGLDKILMEYVDRESYAEAMLQKYDDVNQAYKAIENYDALKRSNVATAMTLDYRIWQITEADRRQAEKDYEAAKNDMAPEEFSRMFNNGQISLNHFDKSARYRDCMQEFIRRKGKFNLRERTMLEDEFDHMVERVLAETDILFTTASNCGGTLLKDSKSFVPTVIFCDEAGQISIPSLCVPLTTFTKWEGLFLFGDVQQLEPTALSGNLNEFHANAKVSPLALLAMKKFRSYLLDTQYRMAPSISKFPRVQFYDGKGLKDSWYVQQDNAVRKAVHKLFLSYGVKGDNNNGSEYVVVDVPKGCSLVEQNGTSLVNHANADIVVDIVENMITTCVVSPSDLKIISYYQGQRRLIRKKINQKPWSKEVKDNIDIEISTVDAFQSRECRVVIVDTVAAKDSMQIQQTNEPGEEPDDEDDTGGEDYIKVGAVTAHVKSPKRLNLAMTRGQDATVVVCQTALLSSAAKKERGKQYNAISNMVADATERHCLLEVDIEDAHPDSIAKRERMGREELEMRQREAKKQNFRFVSAARRNWRDLQGSPATPLAEQLPLYRKGAQHTTRPIGNPELVAQADRFDEQRRISLKLVRR